MESDGDEEHKGATKADDDEYAIDFDVIESKEQDKDSNEPVLLTLKEAELFCAVIKNATVKREDRKKKKKEGKEKPILLEKKYV